MRVLHIVPSYYPGQPAPYEYTRKLAQVGIDVSVIAYGRVNEPAQATLDGVQVYRVPLATRMHFSARTTLRFLHAINVITANEHYDIIHVYAFRGSGLLPLLFHSRATKWVCDIRTGNVSSSVLRSLLADWATRVESCSYDAHIALSEAVGRRLLGGQRAFYTVPLGVDMQKFRPYDRKYLRDTLGLPQDRCIAVFTSVLTASRHPRTLLEAFQLANEQIPRLFLLIIGGGAVEKQVANWLSELKLEPNTLFPGYVPYEQVHHYVLAADIGLAYIPITRQYMLQPPLKTVEYLAAGLPTVATDTLGNRTFVQHGVNGILCDDSAKEYGQSLAALAQDEDGYKQMQQVARSSVNMYDWRAIVQNQLIPAYYQILAGHKKFGSSAQ